MKATNGDKDPKNVPKFANAEGKPREAEADCIDRYPDCKTFLNQGECQKNPGWMIVNCPKSCNSCHLRDPKIRCNRETLNITTSPIYKPGDMNKMFENIEKDFGHYGVQILSKVKNLFFPPESLLG
jgi:hypothetical protein